MSGGFGTILKYLHFALAELDQELQRQLFAEQGAIAAQRRQKASLEQNITQFDENISDLNLQKTFLDTEDLEALTTEGESRKVYQRHGLHRTPDFEFSLKTIFPIRSFSYTSSESPTVWKHLLCELGSYTFSAKLKTRPFKDAAAEILLQGWRKEIHAEEIQSLQRRLDNLRKRYDETVTRVKLTDQQILLSQEKLSKIHIRLDTCSFDRILVESALENPIDCNPLVHSLADVASTSSVASLLNLGSMIESEDAEITCFTKARVSTIESVSITNAFHSAERVVVTANESYHSNLGMLEGYSSSFRKLLTVTVDECGSGDLENLLQDNSSSDLHHDGIRDIESLQESASAVRQKWQDSLNEVQELYDETDAKLETSTTVLKQNCEALQNDIERRLAVCKLRNTLPCPMGVAVAEMEGKTPAAAWMAIYQGLQIEQQAQAVY